MGGVATVETKISTKAHCFAFLLTFLAFLGILYFSSSDALGLSGKHVGQIGAFGFLGMLLSVKVFFWEEFKSIPDLLKTLAALTSLLALFIFLYGLLPFSGS